MNLIHETREFGTKNPSYPHFVCLRDIIESEMEKRNETWENVRTIHFRSHPGAFKRFDNYTNELWLDYLFYSDGWKGTTELMPEFLIVTEGYHYFGKNGEDITVIKLNGKQPPSRVENIEVWIGDQKLECSYGEVETDWYTLSVEQS